MDQIFKNHAINIRMYIGRETIVDPYEGNVTFAYVNPIAIKAIVTDFTSTQMAWKMGGIITEKAKEIIIQKKYRSLLEQSHKIKIDNDEYEGWKVNSKLQIREEGNYIRAYIYTKQV
jgi:hypothetical protein